MGVDAIRAGMDTTHVARTDRERRAARDNKARCYIERKALDQADPEQWRADILGALGLDGQDHKALNVTKER